METALKELEPSRNQSSNNSVYNQRMSQMLQSGNVHVMGVYTGDLKQGGHGVGRRNGEGGNSRKLTWK